METFMLYLGKVALAMCAFYIVFLILFQKQKHFRFNRIYLLASMAVSYLIPLITITITQKIEVAPTQTFFDYNLADSAMPVIPEVQQYFWYHYAAVILAAGVLGFILNFFFGSFKALKIIRKSKLRNDLGKGTFLASADIHPFSFFNKIVVSEKALNHPEINLILAHEKLHAKEWHTLDIVFAEFLFFLQWFNPFAWLLRDAIKNNLEYITDEYIISQFDQEKYQLAMVSLADKKGIAPFLTALNGSQLKNRIIMMKKKTKSKFALVKQLAVIPLLTLLIIGLSNKEFRAEVTEKAQTSLTDPNTNIVDEFVSDETLNTEQEKNEYSDFPIEIKGKITNTEGEIIPFATVLIKEKNIGVATDNDGNYTINVPDEETILRFGSPVSVNQEIKVGNKREINVALKKADVVVTGYQKPDSTLNINSGIKIKGTDENAPLYVVDGKISEDIKNIEPSDIESMTVLKNESAINIYGEKGINGAIIITTGKPTLFDPSQKRIEAFYQTEEMPEFPGGEQALKDFIAKNIKYPEFAKEKGIEGKVYVSFIIDKNGNIKDAKIDKGIESSLDKEALRVINKLPKWKPGKQRGAEVDVSYTVPVQFSLNDKKDESGVLIRQAVGLEGSPLFVIDGIEKGLYSEENDFLKEMDPANIESMTVLKSVTATAMYGEKAKDGAIIITTKKPFTVVQADGSEGAPLIVIDGIVKGINSEEKDYIKELDPENIESVTVIKDEKAIAKYGEKGENGVIEITTKNSSAINTELELRRFIANEIRYPLKAQEKNLTGTVKLYIEFNFQGEIIKISEDKLPGEVIPIEVIVVGYKNPDLETDINSNDLEELVKEAKRVSQKIPEIQIPSFLLKTVELSFNFQLQ